MSNLVTHAERELRLAGLFDKDSDYDGETARAVMALVTLFSSQGHSGGSAHMVLHAFERVARFKTLTDITSDPAEWMDVAEIVAEKPGATWQNRRQSSCFSTDGGKTYYDIDAGDDRAVRVTPQPSTTTQVPQ